MSRDAIIGLFNAPSAKLLALAFLFFGLVFSGGVAWAGITATDRTVAQHEERISLSEKQIGELQRLRLIDSFNLYLVCKSDNPNGTDCKKPE